MNETHKHTENELRETLAKMRALISRARAVAEPILAKWDAESKAHR